MANVDVIITTIDKSTPVVKKVAKENMALFSSLEKAGEGVKNFATQNATLLAGLAAVGVAVYKTIDATQKYNQQVLDMMISTNGTAEETSKLIQVVDDTGVSYDTLKNAMKLAVKNGVQPNIESISALSDEYLALKDPVKQGQLLMEKFGKSGLEMGRVMVLGGDALRKMSADMKGGLVATQANIAASESYRKTLDNLEDTIKGLTVTAGNELIPVLDDALKVVTADIEGFGSFVDIFKQLDNIMKIYPPGADRAARATKLFADAAADAVNSNLPSFMEDASKKTDSATESYIAMAQSFSTIEKAAEEAIDPMKEITEINKNFISGVANATRVEEDYSGKVKSLTEERIQLEQDRAEEIAKGWATDVERVKDYDIALEENKQKVKDNEVEHKRANNEILLGLAERKFMQDGVLDDKEFQWLLDKGVAWGQYSATAVEEMKKAEEEIAILTNGINGLPTAKDIRINLITSGGAILDLANSPVSAPVGTHRNTHATGGDFLIPMSYGNEGFQMGNGDTASGGERVSITPKGGTGQPSTPQLTERGIAKAIVSEMIKHGMGSMGR